MVRISPKGQDLISGKTLETQLPVVIVGIKPTFPANKSALTDIAERAAKTGAKNGAQSLGILLVFGVKRK